MLLSIGAALANPARYREQAALLAVNPLPAVPGTDTVLVVGRVGNVQLAPLGQADVASAGHVPLHPARGALFQHRSANWINPAGRGAAEEVFHFWTAVP